MKKKYNIINIILKVTTIILLIFYTIDFIFYYLYYHTNLNEFAINIQKFLSHIIFNINETLLFSEIFIFFISTIIYIYNLKKKKINNIKLILNYLIMTFVSNLIHFLGYINKILILKNFNLDINIIILLIDIIFIASLIVYILTKNKNNKFLYLIPCISLIIINIYYLIKYFTLISIIDIISYIMLLIILSKNNKSNFNINYIKEINNLTSSKKKICILNLILLIILIFTLKTLFLVTNSYNLTSYIILIIFFTLTNQKNFLYIVLIIYGIGSIYFIQILNSTTYIIILIIFIITFFKIEKLENESNNYKN